MFSTVGDVKYCGGIPSVLWRIVSNLKAVQYCRGCSVLKGYHQYFGGVSTVEDYVQLRTLLSAMEDVQKLTSDKEGLFRGSYKIM